ncbi:acyloxyacyl hydrolase [Syntrophus aciditrophicus]|nr:acyloxyacyl hydrolase [Syntrophus aciditrophicus]
MKGIYLLFKQSFPLALIAIFCLYGCAVIPRNPHQSVSMASSDPRANASQDIEGFKPDIETIISTEGGSSGYESFASIFHENDSDRTANLKNAGNGLFSPRQRLVSVTLRATVSRLDLLGDKAPEEFWEYGVSTNVRMPWAWYSPSGWGLGTRLMGSAGALYGAGETALVVSLIPLVFLGSQDGKFTLDMGAGGALLSRHRFGTQDYGGYFQFALTAGVGVPLFERLGAGYRYMHYSDAGINGDHTTGADMHMLELSYRF